MENAKLLILNLWLLAFLVPGCNESLQTTSYSDSVSIDDLVPEAIQIIREGLADENPRIRANVVEVIADTKQINLMPKVHRLLKDEFVPVRFSAALAAGDLKYRFAEKSLTQLLKDQNENVRIAAAYALARLGKPNSFELVRKAMTSSDQMVRANAALLLGKSGDKNAIKLLYHTMIDEKSDDKTLFMAAEARAALGDERIFPKLWAMLISVYADDRIVGIRAMGALGTIQAKNALITMLDDEVLEVRLAAAGQLGMLKDTIGEPEVLDVFTKNLTDGMDKEDVERINVLTALAIGRIGTASLTKFLPQLLRDESKFVRIAAAKAVLQCTAKN